MKSAAKAAGARTAAMSQLNIEFTGIHARRSGGFDANGKACILRRIPGLTCRAPCRSERTQGRALTFTGLQMIREARFKSRRRAKGSCQDSGRDRSQPALIQDRRIAIGDLQLDLAAIATVMSQWLPKRRTSLAGGQIPSIAFGAVKRYPNQQTEFNQSRGTEMQYSSVIRSTLAAIALTTASIAHATDWSLHVLEGCGGQISGTFSTDSAGLVTSTKLLLSGGGCSVPNGGIRYDSSAANIIEAYSPTYFHVTSSSVGGNLDYSDNLLLEFANPLTQAGAAAGYNSLVYHDGGPFGGLTSERVDRFADTILIAGYAAPITSAVPEPSSFALMLAGCAVFGRLTRRRRVVN